MLTFDIAAQRSDYFRRLANPFLTLGAQRYNIILDRCLAFQHSLFSCLVCQVSYHDYRWGGNCNYLNPDGRQFVLIIFFVFVRRNSHNASIASISKHWEELKCVQWRTLFTSRDCPRSSIMRPPVSILVSDVRRKHIRSMQQMYHLLIAPNSPYMFK